MEENINNIDTQENETVTMTKAELEALKQRVGDQRVTQASKTFEKSKQEDIKKAVAEALKKAKDLDGLDKEARMKEEYEEALRIRDEEINNLRIAQNRSEIKNVLAARGLPIELAEYIDIKDDVEENQRIIEALNKIFNKSIDEGIKKRIGSDTPKKNNPLLNPSEMTRKIYESMTMREQQNYNNAHPEFAETRMSWYGNI